MKIHKLKSDYDPDTILTLIQNDDSDIIVHIYGNGEFRIATSGSQLSGFKKTAVIKLFSKIIDVLNNKENPREECSIKDSCNKHICADLHEYKED